MAMIESLQANNDEIALLTLREIYRSGNRENFQQETLIQAKVAGGAEQLDEDERGCLELLLGNTEAHLVMEKQHKEVMFLSFRNLHLFNFWFVRIPSYIVDKE